MPKTHRKKKTAPTADPAHHTHQHVQQSACVVSWCHSLSLSLVPCPLSLVPVPVPCPLSMVPGPWSLVPGPCSLLPGPWSLVPCPLSLVPCPLSLVPCPLSLVPGFWFLVPAPCSLFQFPAEKIRQRKHTDTQQTTVTDIVRVGDAFVPRFSVVFQCFTVFFVDVLLQTFKH